VGGKKRESKKETGKGAGGETSAKLPPLQHHHGKRAFTGKEFTDE